MNTATLTRPGWYYVGDGELRFHDEQDWTDHVLLAEDIRGHDWPPPHPSTGEDAPIVSIEEPAPKRSRFSFTWMRHLSA